MHKISLSLTSSPQLTCGTNSPLRMRFCTMAILSPGSSWYVSGSWLQRATCSLSIWPIPIQAHPGYRYVIPLISRHLSLPGPPAGEYGVSNDGRSWWWCCYWWWWLWFLVVVLDYLVSTTEYKNTTPLTHEEEAWRVGLVVRGRGDDGGGQGLMGEGRHPPVFSVRPCPSHTPRKTKSHQMALLITYIDPNGPYSHTRLNSTTVKYQRPHNW